MRLKTYRAGSIVQAMAQIRAELGADALILSSRRVAGGVEVAACLEPSEDALPAAASTEPPLPYSTRDTPGKPPWSPRARPAPGHAAPLQWHGVPGDLAARLAAGNLTETLAASLRFGTLPLGEPAPILLTGAPGAGKTLTTARLATRQVLAGQTPLVISADGRRAGAAEELAAYTRLLGIDLIVAHTPATIARALSRRPHGAPVLIDTAGINPFDPAQMRLMAELVANAAAAPVMVLAAGQDPLEAMEQAEAFAALALVHHLVPTRLDMARRLGGVIAAAHAGGMILSEAGTGPGATDGLTRLTPALLADWLGHTPPALSSSPNPARSDGHARHP
jgi:flagellar biosynthesis protein FlhF